MLAGAYLFPPIHDIRHLPGDSKSHIPLTLPTVIWRASREGVCLGFCLVGDKKHTHVNTHVNIGTQNTHTHTDWISRARARWCSDEYSMYHTGMQQPNEETYPGPLLVHIELLYPHRE